MGGWDVVRAVEKIGWKNRSAKKGSSKVLDIFLS